MTSQLVNAVNRIGLVENKAILMLKDLKKDELYPIQNIRNVQGKYGLQTLVELENNVVFLPRRMIMDDGTIEEIKGNQLALVFRGMKFFEAYQKESPMFEFIKPW